MFFGRFFLVVVIFPHGDKLFPLHVTERTTNLSMIFLKHVAI